MHKKPPVCESCGHCFLILISDQLFAAFVPIFVWQTMKIALLLAFIVEPTERKILSHSGKNTGNTLRILDEVYSPVLFCLFCSDQPYFLLLTASLVSLKHSRCQFSLMQLWKLFNCFCKWIVKRIKSWNVESSLIQNKINYIRCQIHPLVTHALSPEVRCPPIVPVKNILLSPPACGKRAVPPGSACLLTCPQGYMLRGNRKAVCLGSGNWTANVHKAVCTGK